MKFDYQIRGIVLENRFFHHRSLTLSRVKNMLTRRRVMTPLPPSEYNLSTKIRRKILFASFLARFASQGSSIHFERKRGNVYANICETSVQREMIR